MIILYLGNSSIYDYFRLLQIPLKTYKVKEIYSNKFFKAELLVEDIISNRTIVHSVVESFYNVLLQQKYFAP